MDLDLEAIKNSPIKQKRNLQAKNIVVDKKNHFYATQTSKNKKYL